MRRREFITILGAAAAWPHAALSQRPAIVPRIGYLVTGSVALSESRALTDVFRQGLRDLGYVEGQNVVIEYRWAEGKIERFQELAAELVALNVDLIVVGSTAAARATQHATRTTPIVSYAMTDAVGDGLVASLARPGGNLTGLTFLGAELIPKQLDLLKHALPSVAHVSVLWHSRAFSERTASDMRRSAETAARVLGIELQMVGVQRADELDRAFSTMTSGRAEALLVFPSPMLFLQRPRVVELANSHRLPVMTGSREFADLGALMAYGASQGDLVRRGAIYVDKILKGAKPAELPIEQPTKFELVINLKTAKALGLTLPPTLLALADEVIE